jgi:non-specific serine/threonine protein kinase
MSLERLAPWREQYVFSGVALMGSVARVTAALAGLLGRHEDAARDFVLAEAVDGRVGAVGPLARTWIDHGRWLLARGDDEQGRARIERGRKLAAEHSLGGLVALADAALGVEREVAAPTGPTPAALVREGDVWTLDFDGTVTRLKDAKGLHYLVRLLRDPGVEQHALDLVGPGNGGGASAEGLEVRADTGDAGPALDAQAKAEYRSRVAELRAELEEAESFNDPERAARAREELDWISQALSQAVGLGGRDRPQSSDAERARVNVTRAIKAVVKRIADHDARAARVLDTNVRTGVFCVYTPDPDRPVDWTLPD